MLLLAKPTDIIPSHRNSTKRDNKTFGKDSLNLLVVSLSLGSEIFKLVLVPADTNKTGYHWAIRNATSPIRSVITFVINKSDKRCPVVRFSYHSCDYRPNWTPLSPVTITNSGKHFLEFLSNIRLSNFVIFFLCVTFSKT